MITRKCLHTQSKTTPLTNYKESWCVYQWILHYVSILRNICSFNWSLAETSILLLIGALFSRSFYAIYILIINTYLVVILTTTITCNFNIPIHAFFSVSHFVWGQQPLANLKQDYIFIRYFTKYWYLYLHNQIQICVSTIQRLNKKPS